MNYRPRDAGAALDAALAAFAGVVGEDWGGRASSGMRPCIWLPTRPPICTQRRGDRSRRTQSLLVGRVYRCLARRCQPSQPSRAKAKPGKPAPTMGPGTAASDSVGKTERLNDESRMLA